MLFPFAQKGLDRIVNRFFVSISESTSLSPCSNAHPQRTHVFAAAVGAFDLAVAEQIHVRQQLLAQQLAGFASLSSPQLSPSENWKQ